MHSTLGEMRNAFSIINRKGRDHFGYQNVNGRIILK
jgi:hypothetical protein